MALRDIEWEYGARRFINLGHRPASVMKGTGDSKSIFNSFRAGGFIFAPFDDSINYDNTDIEQYLTANVDFDALADQIASIGYIDYVIIHAKNVPGFCWWPTEAIFGDGNPFTYNGVTVPQYGSDFHIGNSHYSGLSITSDHLQRFMTAFRSRGIKAGFYYNIGEEHNYRTDMARASLQEAVSSAIYGKYDEFHQYCIDQLQELVRWYSPDIIWLDTILEHPWLNNSGENVRWDNHQEIYDAIKSINSGIIVAGNLQVYWDTVKTFYTSGKIKYFPLDVISQEYAYEVADDGEYVDTMTHDGTDYVVPKERLFDGSYSDTNIMQYRWWDPDDPDKQGINVNSIRSQSFFQIEYNDAINKGATTMFNLPVKPASIGAGAWLLDSTYLSRLQNIEIYVPGVYNFQNTHALLVDASGEGVKILNSDCYPSDGSNNDEAFSIEFWYKTPSAVSNTVNLIVARDDGGGAALFYLTRSLGKLALTIQIDASNKLNKEGTSVTLSINTLYHIVVTYDGSETYAGIKIYVGGTEESTYFDSSAGSYTGIRSLNGNFFLDIANFTATQCDGQYQIFRQYNYELSSTEVTTLYNSGTPQALSSALQAKCVQENLFNNTPNAINIGVNGTNQGTVTYQTL